MTYVNATNLGYIIASINDSISANLKSYAISAADNWVNSKVTGIPSSTPALIQQAAEYYAAAILLRILYDTDVEGSASAEWYEKTAEDILSQWISQNSSSTEDYESPYSSNLTPTRLYTKRNLQTVEDDDETDNIDDTRWDRE